MPALVQQGFQLVALRADHHFPPAAHVQPKELGFGAAGMVPADHKTPLLKGGDGLLQPPIAISIRFYPPGLELPTRLPGTSL